MRFCFQSAAQMYPVTPSVGADPLVCEPENRKKKNKKKSSLDVAAFSSNTLWAKFRISLSLFLSHTRGPMISARTTLSRVTLCMICVYEARRLVAFTSPPDCRAQ